MKSKYVLVPFNEYKPENGGLALTSQNPAPQTPAEKAAPLPKKPMTLGGGLGSKPEAKTQPELKNGTSPSQTPQRGTGGGFVFNTDSRETAHGTDHGWLHRDTNRGAHSSPTDPGKPGKASDSPDKPEVSAVSTNSDTKNHPKPTPTQPKPQVTGSGAHHLGGFNPPHSKPKKRVSGASVSHKGGSKKAKTDHNELSGQKPQPLSTGTSQASKAKKWLRG